jgi:tetratricopeptide (TPR) repeat protein
MAGNKSIYDTAMKRAHEYAWANQWERAMKEYGRALSEFPNDRTAQRNMAQCMFRLKQWPQALAAYEKLLAADPTDAFALNRLAEIYLALGQQSSAADAYTRLADLYMENSQVYEAIRALRDLSRALPKNKEVHERLLDLNLQVGDGAAQATEHLALSQLALEGGSLGEAQQHADAAAALDATNPDIRRWVYTVRHRLAEAAGTVQLSANSAEMDMAGGNVRAIGTQLLFQAEPEPPEASELARQAADASGREEYVQAMDLYDQAVRAGAKHASVFYSAGVLFHQMHRSDAAIAYLERALQDPEFAMSANYVLGECQMEMRNTPKAVAAFERALALVEFDKLSRNEADELIELYKAAAEAHLADDNPGRAASLFSNLAGMFKQRKWSHPQLVEIEKKADELYNRSIQHKLEGISRGSAMLDPAKVPEMGTQAMPSLDGETTSTSGLPLNTTVMEELPPAPPAPEMATALMTKPGSSLRSITEYLRAAEAAQQSGPLAAGDGTNMLPRVVGTDILPLPNSALDTEFAAELADLPDTIIEEKTDQDLATQLLIAEGEHAMAEGQWFAAIDSCWLVITSQPGYLPMHMMLGDIFLHLGRPADAAAKYQVVMDTYMVRGKAEKAAEVCERLLLLQPDNPALQTRLGVLLMEAGRVDDSARALLTVADRHHQGGDTTRALEEALILKESLVNSSDVALYVGTYEMLLDRTAEAVVELSRALQLNPGNDNALIRLYVCLAQMDDPAQWDALQSVLERAAKGTANTRSFMEELHKAIKRIDSPALYYALAVMAARAGLDDIAADSLDQGILSISLSDTGPLGESSVLVDALMAQMRADMAINAKEWGLAVRHYTRALEVAQDKTADGSMVESKVKSQNLKYDFTRLADPVQLYYGLAEAQASQSNWDGALQALKTLKTLIPEDQGVNTRLADIYFRQGHLTDALGELNDVLVAYQKANDTERTLETLGHMARLAPNNVAVRRKLSDLYLKLGMTDQGVTELNTLAELQLKAGLLKDAMRTYGKAADLHYTLGQHDKAIGIYEKIVRIAPRDLDARDQLVNMYIQAGKIDEAVASERALAELFIQEGRAEDAIAALHQLLALAPEDVQGHYTLAKQLTAIGEYGQAARLYGRLLRLDPENDRLPALQTEMQRLEDEKETEVAGKASRGEKKKK